ncbi:MAG: response regulator [Bacteroidota bacterium]
MEGEGERILLVDDDPDLRAMVCSQLRQAGFEPEEAEDGTAALDKLGRTSFPVMLLDIMLPGMSGLEVLQKARERHPSCKVIMLTGMAGLSAAIESLKSGAEDYITKPYSMEYLLTSIRRALGRRC